MRVTLRICIMWANVRLSLIADIGSMSVRFVPEAASPVWRKSEASRWLSGQGDQIDHDDT